VTDRFAEVNLRRETKGKLKKGSIIPTRAVGRAPSPPRIPPTTPLAVFERSIKRARNLLTIHKMALGTARRPPALLADIHRATIVLAVSALDAYIRTLVINRVISKLKEVGNPVPTKLREQIKQLLGQDELIDAARIGDLSTRVEKALREKMEESSYQGVRKITEVMKLIGHEDIFKDIAHSASVNEQTLKENIGKFTKRRHIIAHCGDYDLSQTPPEEKSITKRDAEECIRTIESISREIDKVCKL